MLSHTPSILSAIELPECPSSIKLFLDQCVEMLARPSGLACFNYSPGLFDILDVPYKRPLLTCLKARGDSHLSTSNNQSFTMMEDFKLMGLHVIMCPVRIGQPVP